MDRIAPPRKVGDFKVRPPKQMRLSIYSTDLYQGVIIPVFGNQSIARIVRVGNLQHPETKGVGGGTRGYTNAYYKTRSSIKVPRDKRAGGYPPVTGTNATTPHLKYARFWPRVGVPQGRRVAQTPEDSHDPFECPFECAMFMIGGRSARRY